MKTYRFQRPRPKVDKPKDGQIWKVLNSSLVIWALTVGIGSLATFTFTNLQSCLKDADEKATRANKVFGELLDRRVAIVHAIKDSKNITDLSGRLKGIDFIRFEFKDVPIVSLAAELKEFQKITHKLPFAEAWGLSNIAASGLSEDDLPYFDVFGGANVNGRSEAFLSKLKEILPKYVIYLNRELAFAAHIAVVPYCTVPDAFASMWRSRDRILEFKEFDVPREAPYVPLLPSKG